MKGIWRFEFFFNYSLCVVVLSVLIIFDLLIDLLYILSYMIYSLEGDVNLLLIVWDWKISDLKGNIL